VLAIQRQLQVKIEDTAKQMVSETVVPADVAFEMEWQKHPGHTGLLLTADGGHLNALGNQVVAETALVTWV